MWNKPYIIAEIGNNHEGSVEVAHKMLSKAASSGASAVKFQMFAPELLSNKSDADRIALLTKFMLSEDDFFSLAKHAKSLNIDFLSSAFDEKSLRFLSNISSAVKIASGDNDNPSFLSIAKQIFERVYISLGLLSEKEIEIFFDQHYDKKIVPFHCVSLYPHGAEDSLINVVDIIGANCPIGPYGYSDHTKGNVCSLIAYSKGASIFEKHFTLDNDYSEYRDHKVALNPYDFSHYVSALGEAHSALSADETLSRKKQEAVSASIRRSAVASRDIEVGETISKENTVFVRPAGGIAPSSEQKLFGCVAKNKIFSGETLSWESVQ